MRLPRTNLVCALSLLLFATAACASSGAPSTNTSGASILTGEDVMATNEPDLYRAMQKLRPSWLRPRGQTGTSSRTEVTLFLDGAALGSVSNLNTIPIVSVVEIRFYSASEAGFAFGTLAGSGGTLSVRTRR